MPHTSNANFRIRAVRGDAVEPGAKGRITPERLDPPDHRPEGILDDLLGIRAVTGDAHSQAIDAISVQSDQRLDGPRLLPAQCLDEVCVAIRVSSMVGERQLSHCDSLPCGMVLPPPRVYRGTVSRSSPGPWKMT